jgi:hypothetical protein
MENDPRFSEWLHETIRLRGLGDQLPSRMYKFLSPESEFFSSTIHEVMLKNRVRLSCRTEFNDPFDTSFGLEEPDTRTISSFLRGISTRQGDLSPLPDEYVQSAAGNPAEFKIKAHKGISKTLDRFGIFSMTESIRHPLMWAHYGCSHRGISLVFRHASEEDSLGGFPIRYQDEYPRSTLAPEGIDIIHVFAKGRAWEYEKEWRLVYPDRAREWLDIPPKSLIGIVFGINATQTTYDSVLEFAKKRRDLGLPSISLYKAIAHESFQLSFMQFVGNSQWRPVELS